MKTTKIDRITSVILLFLGIFFYSITRNCNFCVFVFSDMLRYTTLKTCNTFTLDNVYRSPSCIEFVLLTIFYGKDNMHDSFITLDGKSLI